MPFQVKNANYNALRKLNLRERLAAASDSSMGQVLIQMLSPSQISDLFPKYWLERNPNISGFLKAIPSSMSATRQREYERQIQNTASGSAAGANYDAGGYRREWQKEMDAEQERSQVTRKNEVLVPQLSPEQKAAFNALKAGDIDINDERMKWLKNVPEDVRKRVGIDIKKDDKGNEKFHYTAPQVSEEQAKEGLSQSYLADENAGDRQKSIIREANKLGISPKDLAAVMFYETGGRLDDPNIVNRKGVIDRRSGAAAAVSRGADPHFFGLIQFGTHEQLEYGVRPGMNFSDQMSAVGNYLRKKGYSRWLAANPNASEMEKRIALYSTINAGGPDKSNWGKNDLRYGGSASSVVEKTQQIFSGSFYQRADKFMGNSYAKDSITQNYSAQQIAARQREMESSIEATRLGKLASATQPGGPINAAGPVPEYKGNIPGHFGKNEQCASLSKHFAPGIGAASGWTFNHDIGAIKPGAVIATTSYGPNGHGGHPGGIEASKTWDGKSHYHTGVALTSPNSQGEVLILEQFNGHSPRVRKVNINDYNGEKMRVVNGGEPSASTMEAVSIGRQLAPPDSRAWIDGETGHAPPAQESEKRTTLPNSEKKKVTSGETDVEAQGIKPLSSVTQPSGPVNAAGPVAPAQPEPPAGPTTPKPTPQATPTAAVEPPKPAPTPAAPSPERYNVNVNKFTDAIRQTEDFKRQAGMFGSMVPNSTIISGFNDDPRVKAAGVRLDDKGVMHFSKGMTPDVKEVMSTFDTKSFMTKIEEKKKEDVAATKVKAMAEGGPVPVNTEQITAYPIGGLRGDNAVVVNAHQKPLFTMNTNENVLMDPNNNRAQVIPNTKGTNVGPMPKENMTSGIMEDFNSTIQEIRKDFASLKADKATTPNMSPASPAITENGWLGRLSDTANDPFKTPSIRRVAYRAGGMETGEPYSGFHHSRGNNS